MEKKSKTGFRNWAIYPTPTLLFQKDRCPSLLTLSFPERKEFNEGKMEAFPLESIKEIE